MNREEQLQDIRNAVAKVVDLSVHIPQGILYENNDPIQREIRLADILAAIRDKNIFVMNDGSIIALGKNACKYDLLYDDLTLQSDDLIAFVHNILV